MWLSRLVAEFWNVLQQSATFILLGFLFAAGLHVVMSRSRWGDWLKTLKARSVFLAAVLAAPLPLCSCSVIPAAVSLRKRGASKGSVLSFLISAPETNVELITLTWGLLGPVFAIFRPIAGLVTAIVAGLSENFIERRWPSAPLGPAEESGPTCCGDAPAKDSDECCAHDAVTDALTKRATWRDGLRHAFVDVFDDVVGWMLFGVLVAALISVLVPGYVIDAVFGPPLQAMLIMLIIGIPLYVCAEASTPIAAALILQGVNPGAALVFLLAGPATNIGSIFVLKKHLGRRTVIVYLATIAVIAMLMGLILNGFCDLRGIDLSQRALSEPMLPNWLKNLGAIAFLVMAVLSAIRLRYLERLVAWLDRTLPVRVTVRRLTAALLAFALAAYAATGFAVVDTGQVGMSKCFGRVVAENVPPGLHFVWPYPIGSMDRIDTRAVYRVELGASSTAQTAESAEDDRAWVLLGDENIANIRCAAHWRMAAGASRAFAYRTADREEFVATAVRAALRGVLGSAGIDTVFTTDQANISAAVLHEAQHMLDRGDCGIELVAFTLLDLHAPPQVHEAFRDVASAVEDRATRRNQALMRQAEIEPLARGTRDKLILAARADERRLGAEAAGEADAFREMLAAYHEFPDITRTRLMLEMYDRVLPGRKKFIRPTSANVQLDLRFGGNNAPAEAP